MSCKRQLQMCCQRLFSFQFPTDYSGLTKFEKYLWDIKDTIFVCGRQERRHEMSQKSKHRNPESQTRSVLSVESPKNIEIDQDPEMDLGDVDLIP